MTVETKLRELSELALSLAETFKNDSFSAQVARNESNFLERKKRTILEELAALKAEIDNSKIKAEVIIANAEKKANKIVEDAYKAKSIALVYKEETKKELERAKEESDLVIKETKLALQGR